MAGQDLSRWGFPLVRPLLFCFGLVFGFWFLAEVGFELSAS
jgi:hypothetical protein